MPLLLSRWSAAAPTLIWCSSRAVRREDARRRLSAVQGSRRSAAAARYLAKDTQQLVGCSSSGAAGVQQ
jgi:hypothetical protein